MTTLALEDVSALATLARRLCGNSFDADDLVQDTIERALKAAHRYDEQGNRRGYLATILRNQFLDRCRSARRRPRCSDELDLVAAPETAAPAVWEHFTGAEIEAALAQLPAGFRQVYELHARGWAYADIARQLGLSMNTVGTRLLRAREKLRAILVASLAGDDRRHAAGADAARRCG